MDSEGNTQKFKKKISNDVSDTGNVLQSIRVRRNVRNDNELDRVLLDYGFNFLLPFGTILWVIFLVITNI